MRATLDHDRHLHSWVYTAGVIASFVAVAALLIALQQAGQAIGWGFQLQSPGFVIALAYLFVAMGLSLSGLVEFGGQLMNTGSGLADRGGLSGSFFTGVLAVVVASPCTAPFMGTALGFAVTQPPHGGLLVFASLGAGMAAPLLLFSYSGAAAQTNAQARALDGNAETIAGLSPLRYCDLAAVGGGRQTGVNTMASPCAAHCCWPGLVAVAPGQLAQGPGRGLPGGGTGLGAWRGLDQEMAESRSWPGRRVAWSEQQLASLAQRGTRYLWMSRLTGVSPVSPTKRRCCTATR